MVERDDVRQGAQFSVLESEQVVVYVHLEVGEQHKLVGSDGRFEGICSLENLV